MRPPSSGQAPWSSTPLRTPVHQFTMAQCNGRGGRARQGSCVPLLATLQVWLASMTH